MKIKKESEQMTKILFFQWHSFLNPGIEAALKKLRITYDTCFYQFTEWETDAQFSEQFSDRLGGGDYRMVLSVNFSPLIAQVCHDRGVPYAAWIYDSPIHIRQRESLGYDTTHVFCFDRSQAQLYEKQGIHAYHLPLAASPKLFLKSAISAADRKKYTAQISFLGQLYQTDYAYYCGPLDNYQRGFLEGILKAQSNVYGAYFIPELLTDELLDGMNARYDQASGGTASITKEELEFMLACEVTGRERYVALAVLSNHFQVKYYSGEKDERLAKAVYMGYADYYEQMPKIFRLSDVNLNISLRTIQTGIPLRVLDVLACGGFLISNYQEELAVYFRLGEELVTYGDAQELVYLTDFYLRDEARRRQIARCGQERIKQDFTFEKALQKILKEMTGV